MERRRETERKREGGKKREVLLSEFIKINTKTNSICIYMKHLGINLIKDR